MNFLAIVSLKVCLIDEFCNLCVVIFPSETKKSTKNCFCAILLCYCVEEEHMWLIVG